MSGLKEDKGFNRVRFIGRNHVLEDIKGVSKMSTGLSPMNRRLACTEVQSMSMFSLGRFMTSPLDISSSISNMESLRIVS